MDFEYARDGFVIICFVFSESDSISFDIVNLLFMLSFKFAI